MALRLPLDCRWTVAPSGPRFNSSLAASTSGSPEKVLSLARLSFFGSVQVLRGQASCGKPFHLPKLPFITARIKRRKDITLDNIIQRQKKLKIVTRIKELLVKQPGMVMSLRDLGKNRRYIGLLGKRRCVALLRKFPTVFEVFEEGVNSLYFRFTLEAEDLFFEEQKITEEMESFAVEKVRKLLMMSIDKRILLEKIGHIKRDLGLPDDFRTSFVGKYPQFFKVVETGVGPALELTFWDPNLAITAYERKKEEDALKKEALGEGTISGRTPKFQKIDLPKGYSLTRKDREVIFRFQQMPFISPYSDFSHIAPGTPEAEKHAVAVVHEFLSLTLEKRTLVDHLTHFRRDFKFSQQVRGMLIRHPEFFYVSLKGARDCVFLREAYNGSELIQKDPLVLAKEKLGELVTKGRHLSSQLEIEEDDEEDEDFKDDDWSDAEDADGSLSDQVDSDDDDGDEEVSERERSSRRPSDGESPTLRASRERPRPVLNRERELAMADRRPRERW